jgi:hypothetical protein
MSPSERAPEKLVQRKRGRLAKDVPQRHVDHRPAAILGARAEVADERSQLVPVVVDAKRIPAEEVGSGGLVDPRDHRLGAEEALAHTDESFVGVDLQIGDVGKLPDEDGLDLCDPHRRTFVGEQLGSGTRASNQMCGAEMDVGALIHLALPHPVLPALV